VFTKASLVEGPGRRVVHGDKVPPCGLGQSPRLARMASGTLPIPLCEQMGFGLAGPVRNHV
jgi:hypothetical protein